MKKNKHRLLLSCVRFALCLFPFVASMQTAYAQMQPYVGPNYLLNYSVTGSPSPGSTGGGADCNQAIYDEGQPGDGGSGGTPSAYSYTNTTNATGSSYTTGLMVQSTGGTGGTGGNGSTCYAGRGGGSGGAGGAITLNNGNSSTAASLSLPGTGIIAVSKGGTGGTGGDTGSTLNAGNGGNGGTGGTVTLTNYGSITTTNQSAFGLYGLSEGGNGGNGGKNSNGVYGTGGSGMPGGVGGQVFLYNHGAISTTNAYAMFGISVGGYGGGSGSSSGFVPAPNPSAGYGGVGGNVTLSNYSGGTLTTNDYGQAAMVGISVGGGGGDAGRSASLSQYGANGGPGAVGGTLNITNNGKIQTLSTASVGIAAVSVGGGGGSGGMAQSAFLGGGGSGGGGGDGGQVTVSNTGQICTGGGCVADAASTTGTGLAPAIAALSVGGGGGMGGYSISAGTGGSVSMGGQGGSGGDGGKVWASNTNSLQTTEVASAGILAGSMGGGGGSGGGAFSAAASTLSSMSVAVGGKGGDGGDGGIVGVNCGSTGSTSSSSSACSGAPSTGSPVSGSSITTYGTISPGVMAISVGGGGGTGGFAVSLAEGSTMTSSVSVGGSGGSGGDGGAVYANTGGVKITTAGEFSSGLEALSVGGGGGHGGITMYTPDYLPGGSVSSTSTTINVGGSGGSGGEGGAVLAENTAGVIKTSGDRASGIFAASVGGRGGHGGLASGGAAGLALSLTTSVGGNGGSGNKAGSVTVNNSGALSTKGSDAHAIEALSVGGGGGSGGWSAGAGVALGTSNSFAVGGTGGSGGNGGAVSVTNSGVINASHIGSTGILALSVGGGGGNGGSSASSDVSLTGTFNATVGGAGTGGATGGNVSVTNTGELLTGIDYATNPAFALGAQGIVAMSIGGGGGRGGVSVSGNVSGIGTLGETVGGGSGNGGTGGSVTVTNSGAMAVLGDLSNGILGVSTGGRGGLGGIAVGGSVSTGSALNDTLGSTGGDGGKGGTVSLTNNAGLTTAGFRAIGVSAQSLGGHGGMGGIAVGATLSNPSTASSTVTLGGSGGHGGEGGSASITNSSGGVVSTVGPFSAGLVAQSLGGDGGIGGIGFGLATSVISPSMTLGGSGGSGATGGSASITSSGSVSTSGLSSTGILAQSIGGNGGLSGVTLSGLSSDRAGTYGMNLGNSGGSGATGGSATVNVTGNVTTSATLSSAIVAESIGGGGGRAAAAISLSVANAANLGAAAGSAAVGSTGGGGGNGGTVSLTQTGQVITNSGLSDALVASSVGGGGGSAGMSFINMTSGSKNFNLLAGGQSGSDGTGGSVTLYSNNNQYNSNDTLLTKSAFSDAIFAQSIGGGGGSASGLHSQSSAAGTFESLSRLGSTGGSGGSGGTVNLYTGGSSIATQGVGSSGIVGQSIGGGGGKSLSGLLATTTTISVPDTNIQFTVGSGSAGASNASAGSSTSEPSTTVSLTNVSSTTITAGSAGSMQLGGFATSSGSGGSVSLSSAGYGVTTSGDMSDAIKLQSIGGGGGFSAMRDDHSGSPFAGGSMFLGGGSSGGGDGGSITLTNSASVNTTGSLSLAILAQSLGGGGGDARISSVTSTGLTAGFSASLGVKSGAHGGSGGTISITNSAAITTAGLGADAIVGQSIGGGGGFSALHGSATTASSYPTSASGTSGQSQAGEMGSTSASSSSNAAYAGTSNGNSNTGGAISTIRGASMSGILGASGGNGNDGNTISITNNRSIATGYNSTYSNGDGAQGIVGQSIGGGGGIVRQHLANFDQSQTSMSLMLGGIGSSDGYGSNVTINNLYQSANSTYSLSTTGRAAMGILAQSIGGGGGLAILTEASTGLGGSANLSFKLGGAGTSYGNSGTVSVNLGDNLTTTGDQSQGVVAQSISSGGGVAKASIYASSAGQALSTTAPTASSSPTLVQAVANEGLAFGLGVGSSSTNNANAGSTSVSSTSTINTSGDRSLGIVAQSISGGGGLVDITAASINSGIFAGSVNMGGTAPGTVSTTTVSMTGGSIVTHGNLADGILAQSIAYGGGSVGVVQKSIVSGAGGTMSYKLGTNAAGTSVNADSVSVTTTDITTYGFGASNVTAQSIGGGGGSLGLMLSGNFTGGARIGGSNNSSSYGESVTVTTNGYLSTTNNFAPNVIAQSIGGGGGRVVSNQVQYSNQNYVGADTGRGSAGDVSVTTSYALATYGSSNSPAIIAQSISGGGGILQQPTSTWTNVTLGGTAYGYNPGTVTVTNNGSISTSGNGSIGIVAQSIGGGGGFATMDQANATFGSTNTYSSQTGENGNTVTVNVNNAIKTTGNVAPGVLAMSLGGGGGVAVYSDGAWSSSVTNNKGAGNGGKVEVTVSSGTSITTTGEGSDGIIAASIAGGGGLVLSTAGTKVEGSTGRGSSSSVTVNHYGSVTVSGSNSKAINMLQYGGKDDPTLNMYAGSVVVGGVGGVGVYYDGEINNLNNYGGYISTQDGIAGLAIRSERGTTTVNNAGNLVGNIQMGGSGNSINNLSAGRLFFKNHAEIGTDGLLTNAGYLQYNPAGLTELGVLRDSTGLAINQTSTGVLGVKFDFITSRADLLELSSGSRFNLEGNIKPVLLNAGLIAPGSSLPTNIFQRNDGHLNVDNLGIISTAIMTNRLVKDANGVSMTSTANFAPAGLSQFGSQVGQAIGNYQSVGSNAFFQASTAQLVEQTTVANLDQAYTGLAGTAIQAVPQVMFQAVSQGIGSYTDRINDWRVSTATAKSSRMAAFNQPKRYALGQSGNSLVDAANDGGLIGGGRSGPWVSFFQSNVFSNSLTDRIVGGTIAYELENDRRDIMGGLGVTVSGSSYSYNSSPTPITPGNTTNVGLSFYGIGRGERAYLSGTAYLGGGNTNFTRQLQTMNFNSNTNVNIMSYVAAARIEAGYDFEPFRRENSNMKVTPFVAVQPTYIHQKGAQENFGSLGPGFNYSANDNTAVPVFAGLELSGNHMTEGGTKVSPFIRASWMAETQQNGQMGANFNSNQGVNVFFNGSPNLGNAMQYKVGSVIGGDRVSGYFTLDYDYGNASYAYRNYGVTGGIKYAF